MMCGLGQNATHSQQETNLSWFASQRFSDCRCFCTWSLHRQVFFNLQLQMSIILQFRARSTLTIFPLSCKVVLLKMPPGLWESFCLNTPGLTPGLEGPKTSNILLKANIVQSYLVLLYTMEIFLLALAKWGVRPGTPFCPTCISNMGNIPNRREIWNGISI